MTLKQIIEQSDTRAGRAFDLAVQGVILLSLVSFSLDTLPGLAPATRRWLAALELATIAVFTVEYALRLWVADHRLRFVFSFFGLIDLLAILPFYLTLGVDLRSVRAVRLFRALRVLKIFRYNRAIDRFRTAFWEIREELVLYLAAAVMLIFLVSAGIWHFEHEAQPQHFGSIFHCLWWSVVTLTTVGYGDCYPVTVGGRVFTGLVLFLGMGIVAVPTGLLASALTSARRKEAALPNAEPPREPGSDSPGPRSSAASDY